MIIDRITGKKMNDTLKKNLIFAAKVLVVMYLANRIPAVKTTVTGQ